MLALVMSDLDYLYLMEIEEEERPRRIHKRFNAFNPMDLYDDDEFKMRYRMTKSLASILCNLIAHKIERQAERSNVVTPMIQLLVCLRILGQGPFQLVDGDLFNLAQSAVSNIMRDVCEAIASLAPKFIRMPTRQEALLVKKKFKSIAGMPFVIGAIDCTHIHVRPTDVPDKELFRNRKEDSHSTVRQL